MAATEVNAQIVDGQSIATTQSVSGSPAIFSNMFIGHQVSHSKRLDMAAEEGILQRLGMDVQDSAATAPMHGISSVLTAALSQILTKNAQSTNPETGI